MKKVISVFIPLLLFFNQVHCQKVDTIYFNLFGKEVSPKRCFYYRVAKQEVGFVRVIEIIKKNGHVVMTGNYLDFDFKTKTGVFKYFIDERIHEINIYEPSKYPNALEPFSNILKFIPLQHDSLHLVLEFYKNGKLKTAGYRSQCCDRYGPWLFAEKDNKTLQTAIYENGKANGPTTVYYMDQIIITGSYKNDKEDGKWMYYYSDTGELYQTIIFKNGKKIRWLTGGM